MIDAYVWRLFDCFQQDPRTKEMTIMTTTTIKRTITMVTTIKCAFLLPRRMIVASASVVTKPRHRLLHTLIRHLPRAKAPRDIPWRRAWEKVVQDVLSPSATRWTRHVIVLATTDAPSLRLRFTLLHHPHTILLFR